MLTLEEVKRKLQPMIVKRVAKETGLAYVTVFNIKAGKVDQVSSRTLEKLSNYLENL